MTVDVSGSDRGVLPDARTPFRIRVASRATLVRWAFAIALLILLISPMISIGYQAFLDRPFYRDGAILTLQNFVKLFSDPRFHSAMWNTMWLGIWGTLASTSLGFLAGIALLRIDIPFRRTLTILFLSPLFLSSLILAFAWSMVYGPSGFANLLMKTRLGFGIPNLNSLGGMSLLAGVAAAPVSYLYFSAAMANIPSTLEDAARAAGASPFRAVMSIVLPLLRPSLLYCLLLNFVLKLDLLAVPLVIGLPARIEVLATYLYERGIASANVDYGLISAAAIVMLILVQGFIIMQHFFVGDVRKYNTVGGKTSRKALISAGKWRWVIAGVIFAYCLITSIIPAGFLVLRSFTSFLSPLVPIRSVLTLANFRTVLGYDAYIDSILNTIIVSTVGGAIAVILTFISVFVAYRSSSTLKNFVEQSAFISRAIPGLVVGIGIFYAVSFLPGGGILRGSLAILVIAYIIRYFPTGFASMSPPFLQIGEDIEKAVRVAGGTEIRSIVGVTLPLMWPAILACFLLYFVQFFKEYAAASFLFGPNTAVIGTTMLQLDLMGNFGPVAALSVITMILTVPVAIIAYSKRA